MNKMENVTIFEHPLIQHKISILRDKRTGTNEFRQLVDEIAMLEGFVALSDLPVEDVEVETPIETCMTPMIAGRKLAVVPILRAGLGMVSGILGSPAPRLVRPSSTNQGCFALSRFPAPPLCGTIRPPGRRPAPRRTHLGSTNQG